MLLPNKRLILFQHGFFVLCLAVPTYLAVTRTLTRLGSSPAWYHLSGVAAMSLLPGAVFMLLPKMVFMLAAHVNKMISDQSNRRA